jgi:large subunit ribosomal protein L21
VYGVVEISGHQYRVAPGDLIDVQQLSAEAGTTIDFDKVLFVGGDKPAVGMPIVDGAKVSAKVVRHDRDRKLLVFKRKPGLYQKRKGHRTNYTALLITELTDGQGNTMKIDPENKFAKKYL